MAENEKLLSVTEAATRLGISPHTVNSWVSQGRITFVKVGRRTMFEAADLSELILSNKHQSRFQGKPHLN